MKKIKFSDFTKEELAKLSYDDLFDDEKFEECNSSTWHLLDISFDDECDHVPRAEATGWVEETLYFDTEVVTVRYKVVDYECEGSINNAYLINRDEPEVPYIEQAEDVRSWNEYFNNDTDYMDKSTFEIVEIEKIR
ncbi:MAG: hypothetical protein ACRCZK_01940 [Oscillospiraceae bacterium]